MSTKVHYVTPADLQAIVDRVLALYPWFESYPIDCHAKCARWDIAAEHGYDVGDAWDEYDTAVWMLTAGHAGADPEPEKPPPSFEC